ncbi:MULTISPECIES: DUF397 domain-containing protein [unclassified Streptomyces]|uniref:DUF397 domain-containing protein n=1 Tax=unclassified Streptomyces TaxID=2593676 RepID=UPI0033AAA712
MDPQWQKSSFSTDAEDTNCIELAMQGDEILLRESEEPESIVTTTPVKLAAFLAGVKAGEFDHLV